MDLAISNFTSDLEEMIRTMIARINTAIPGIIESFDPSTQTCSVNPAVKVRSRDVDNNEVFYDLPVITQVPLVFPNAGGFYITLPVKKGDNCLLIFSQRAIDNWHDLGGVQPPEDGAEISRTHHLTDAFAIMSPLPLPETIIGYATDAITIRNSDGTTAIKVQEDAIEHKQGTNSIKVSATGIDVYGDIRFHGNLIVDASKTIKGSSGIDILTHRHTDPQGGTTGVPTT